MVVVVIAITLAVGVEMVVQTEAIDGGDGDDNYDSQESNRSTH